MLLICGLLLCANPEQSFILFSVISELFQGLDCVIVFFDSQAVMIH